MHIYTTDRSRSPLQTLWRRGRTHSIALGEGIVSTRVGNDRPGSACRRGAVLDGASAKQPHLADTWASVREHRLSLLLLAIAGVWLLAAGHWILTDTVVPWDAENEFYAFFRFLASSLHEGYSPLRNPFPLRRASERRRSRNRCCLPPPSYCGP